MHPRISRVIDTPLGVALLGAAVVFAIALALRPLTPRIAFNDGLGYDGQYYAAMVGALRGEPHGPLLADRPNYASRPLAPAIVAASGLDVIRGFLLMNLASLVAAGALLAAIVRHFSGGIVHPLAAVLWWAVLPGSVRYALYYPVLVDGIGLLVLFALAYAAVAQRPVLFTLIVGPAMLARENVIVLVPMLALALVPGGFHRAARWTVIAAGAAFAAYVAVRIAPPIPAAEGFDPIFEARQNIEWLFGNVGDRGWRFANAWLLGLGLFSVVPLVRWRHSLAFLRAHIAWAYYFVVTLILIIVIGGDFDRYFLYFTPVLAVLTFATTRTFRSGAGLAILSAIHIVIVRAGWPVGTSEAGYLRYNVATMELGLLLSFGTVAGVLAIAAALIVVIVTRTHPPLNRHAPTA
jgi:hypothetical protein